MTGLTWAGAAVVAIGILIVFGSALLASAGAPVPEADKQWLMALLLGIAVGGGGGYALGRHDAGPKGGGI